MQHRVFRGWRRLRGCAADVSVIDTAACSYLSIRAALSFPRFRPNPPTDFIIPCNPTLSHPPSGRNTTAPSSSAFATYPG
jgi:hypothetical protein